MGKAQCTPPHALGLSHPWPAAPPSPLGQSLVHWRWQGGQSGGAGVGRDCQAACGESGNLIKERKVLRNGNFRLEKNRPEGD